jgi:hypothetical protein
MRLSEAIMMGSATCKLERGNINSCAFGAALNAEGIPQVTKTRLSEISRYMAVTEIWPWTAQREAVRDYDCGLTEQAREIFRRFDALVCIGIITLEQLVDYVKSIEPDCDCNQFNCSCKLSGEISGEVKNEISATCLETVQA